MRLLMLTLPLILALQLSLPAQQPISFRQLPAGDELVVSYTTSGCFHYAVFELTFSRGAEYTVDVVHVNTQWNRRTKSDEIIGRKHLGVVKLSANDLAGLDSLLAYYRHLSVGGCTTRDHIVFTQNSGSAVKGIETYDDASCGAYAEHELLNIETIIRRCPVKDR
jgi:hypothetical protein